VVSFGNAQEWASKGDKMATFSNLNDLLGSLACQAFEQTKHEAHAAGTCLKCKEPALPKCHTDAGVREYGISGMCESCFDMMFEEE
jgi:hypothetical protein